jgi:hypothetical protein
MPPERQLSPGSKAVIASAVVNCVVVWLYTLFRWTRGFTGPGLVPNRPLAICCCLVASTACALLARPIMSRIEVLTLPEPTAHSKLE